MDVRVKVQTGEEYSEKPYDNVSVPTEINTDRITVIECFLKVRQDVLDNFVFIKPYTIFKMQIQTAVIQVDCPNHGLFVVAYEHFGMDKAGRILKNLHARLQQGLVVGTG